MLIGSAFGLESDAKVTGNDSGWGWNVGVLWQANEQTRIGAAYRSKIKYDVSGQVNFTNPTASSLGPLPASLAPVGAAIVGGINASPLLGNGDVTLAVEMPDTANVSVFHQFNNKWDLMADIQYTGWSSIQELKIVRSTGVVLSNTPENFRDTWRASVGANYRYSDKWIFRGGLAYDQSPVRDAQLGDRPRLGVHLRARSQHESERRQHRHQRLDQRVVPEQCQHRRPPADLHGQVIAVTRREWLSRRRVAPCGAALF